MRVVRGWTVEFIIRRQEFHRVVQGFQELGLKHKAGAIYDVVFGIDLDGVMRKCAGR